MLVIAADDLAIAPICASSTLGGMNRLDGRAADQIRPVTFELGIAPHASGSVLVAMGNTRVICGVMIEESVPRWMKEQGVTGGWLTAEYSMLPYSTNDAKAARHHERQARRPQQRDPAADRPLAARGGRSGETRAAHDVGRLRCAAGRRRDAHGGDHRGEPGRRGRLPEAGGGKKIRASPIRETGRSGERRCDRRTSRCSI